MRDADMCFSTTWTIAARRRFSSFGGLRAVLAGLLRRAAARVDPPALDVVMHLSRVSDDVKARLDARLLHEAADYGTDRMHDYLRDRLLEDVPFEAASGLDVRS